MVIFKDLVSPRSVQHHQHVYANNRNEHSSMDTCKDDSVDAKDKDANEANDAEIGSDNANANNAHNAHNDDEKSCLYPDDELFFFQFKGKVTKDGSIGTLGFDESFLSFLSSSSSSPSSLIDHQLSLHEWGGNSALEPIDASSKSTFLQSNALRFLRNQYATPTSWIKDCYEFCNGKLLTKVDGEKWALVETTSLNSVLARNRPWKHVKTSSGTSLEAIINRYSNTHRKDAKNYSNMNAETSIMSRMKPSVNHVKYQYFTSALLPSTSSFNVSSPYQYQQRKHSHQSIDLKRFNHHPFHYHHNHHHQVQKQYLQGRQSISPLSPMSWTAPVVSEMTVSLATDAFNEKPVSSSRLYDLSESFFENMSKSTSFHLTPKNAFPNAYLPPPKSSAVRSTAVIPFESAACCSRIDRTKSLIFCSNCCESYHLSCLYEDEHDGCEAWKNRRSLLTKAKNLLDLLAKNSVSSVDDHVKSNHPLLSQWKCPACLVCTKCLKSKPEPHLLVCDKCDRGFHMGCLLEPLTEIPEGNWLCDDCVECKGCGSKNAKGCGLSGAPALPKKMAVWSLDYKFCGDCVRSRKDGNFCHLCDRCYSPFDYDTPMIQCDYCEFWIHVECDPSMLKHPLAYDAISLDESPEVVEEETMDQMELDENHDHDDDDVMADESDRKSHRLKSQEKRKELQQEREKRKLEALKELAATKFKYPCCSCRKQKLKISEAVFDLQLKELIASITSRGIELNPFAPPPKPASVGQPAKKVKVATGSSPNTFVSKHTMPLIQPNPISPTSFVNQSLKEFLIKRSSSFSKEFPAAATTTITQQRILAPKPSNTSTKKPEDEPTSDASTESHIFSPPINAAAFALPAALDRNNGNASALMLPGPSYHNRVPFIPMPMMRIQTFCLNEDKVLEDIRSFMSGLVGHDGNEFQKSIASFACLLCKRIDMANNDSDGQLVAVWMPDSRAVSYVHYACMAGAVTGGKGPGRRKAKKPVAADQDESADFDLTHDFLVSQINRALTVCKCSNCELFGASILVKVSASESNGGADLQNTQNAANEGSDGSVQNIKSEIKKDQEFWYHPHCCSNRKKDKNKPSVIHPPSLPRNQPSLDEFKFDSSKGDFMIRMAGLLVLELGTFPIEYQHVERVLDCSLVNDYLYPIGFKSLRTYWSYGKPFERTLYLCEVLILAPVEGDKKYLFKVTALDNPETGAVCTGFTIQECLKVLFERLRKAHDNVGGFKKRSSGSDGIKIECFRYSPSFMFSLWFFGLFGPVMEYIEGLDYSLNFCRINGIKYVPVQLLESRSDAFTISLKGKASCARVRGYEKNGKKAPVLRSSIGGKLSSSHHCRIPPVPENVQSSIFCQYWFSADTAAESGSAYHPNHQCHPA